MKLVNSVIIGSVVGLNSFVQAASVQIPEERFDAKALEVSMTGTGPAVDQDAYQQLQEVVTGYIKNHLVKKYLLRGIGFEGGSAFCIEMQSPEDLDEVLSNLALIKPNPVTTDYSVNKAIECK